jgi:hypothetical protein
MAQPATGQQQRTGQALEKQQQQQQQDEVGAAKLKSRRKGGW